MRGLTAEMTFDNIQWYYYGDRAYTIKFGKAIKAQIKNHYFWTIVKELAKLGFTRGWYVKFYNDSKVRFIYANDRNQWKPTRSWKDIQFTLTDCSGRLHIDKSEDIEHDVIQLALRRGHSYYFGCKVPRTKAGIEKLLTIVSNIKNNVGYHTDMRYEYHKTMYGIDADSDRYIAGTRDLDKEAIESPWI